MYAWLKHSSNCIRNANITRFARVSSFHGAQLRKENGPCEHRTLRFDRRTRQPHLFITRTQATGARKLESHDDTGELSISGLGLLQLNDSDQQGLARLIEAYRIHGHKKANINPLCDTDETVEELNPENYGLTHSTVVTLPDGQTAEISDFVSHLEHVFCGTISVETSQLETILEKEFICRALAEARNGELSGSEKRRLAELLVKSEGVDHFIDMKFKTTKRYGGEGAESSAVFVEEIFRAAAESEIEQIVVGTPHRGKINILIRQLKLSPEIAFRKIKGLSEFPDEMLNIATGDVLSHLTSSVDLEFEGKKIHVTLLPCPSHLEAVDPVTMGKCRGRQQTLTEGQHSTDQIPIDGKKALCFVMHGDAAFSGQGIVAECFVMANLPHFTVGGTVHLIVNNQIGFTTPAHRGRSSRYTSDIGKIIGCPVIHVNGDHPEDVARAARIALNYRNTFQRDIIVDLLCYRRWGHNEMDDPSFTQPIMYEGIEARQSVPEIYAQNLVESGIVTSDEVSSWKQEMQTTLNQHLKNAESYKPPPTYLEDYWSNMTHGNPSTISNWDTGYPIDNLRFIGMKSVEVPDSLQMHSRLVKMYADARKDKVGSLGAVDWATAEALAFGSLLQQGFNIRICGQDVGRGTFSQRHAVVVCQDSEDTHTPLNHISEDQKAQIEVVNSFLSEEAVLGFEYGMSIESPNRLVIWEAQFGDFFTGAQIIIDTFVNSGEAKWLTQSGLVMLLPHGYDGMGPEHSSCRIERFLQATNSKEDEIDGDGVNIHFCNPTTPAQYFHLLRRQMIRNYRKPLIVASPKTLLRLPAATSDLAEMASGTTFRPVLPDDGIQDLNKVEKILFCSGKHYYALVNERKRLGLDSNIAIVRVEELCPFPTNTLRSEVTKFPNVKSFIWAQEEPRNMGAWSFVNTRFENLLGVKIFVRYCSDIRQIFLEYCSDIARILLGYCLDIARIFLEYCSDIPRILLGYSLNIARIFLEYCSDIPRILLGYSSNIARIFFEYSSDILRILLGYCPDIARILLGYSSNIARIFFEYCSDILRILLGYCPDIPRILLEYCLDISRILLEYSSNIARIFLEYCSNILRIFFGYSLNIPRILPEYCSNIARIFFEYCLDISRVLLGYSSNIPRILLGYSSNIARIFFEYSSDIARILLGYSPDIPRILLGYSYLQLTI